MINQGDRISISAEVIRVCRNGMLNVRLSDGQLVHIRADEVREMPREMPPVIAALTETDLLYRAATEHINPKRGPGRPRKVLA